MGTLQAVTTEPASILVVTVVHDPRDARIMQRQIRALLSAGDHVTFAAPFADYGVTPPLEVTSVNLPRAIGRRRGAALREARRTIARLGPRHDAVLLHDPELLVAAAGNDHPVVVWDVHEDTAAALALKSWLPSAARPAVASAVSGLESRAESRHHLLLAEERYRDRFEHAHPVVPNSTPVPDRVPPPERPEAVYVGRVSVERGGLDLIEVGRLLADRGVTVVVIGNGDDRMRGPLAEAHECGWITWEGFLPNDAALRRVEGSSAGLSLLHDQPNYRHSMPTKVAEYLARGVPVVTTPLPLAERLVLESGGGVVVPFGDPQAAAEAVIALVNDPERRRAMGASGHEYALRELNWNVDGPRFVAQLHAWIDESRQR